MVSINVYSFKKINKLTASNMFYLNNKYRAFYNKDEYFPIVPVVTELKLIIKKGNFIIMINCHFLTEIGSPRPWVAGITVA